MFSTLWPRYDFQFLSLQCFPNINKTLTFFKIRLLTWNSFNIKPLFLPRYVPSCQVHSSDTQRCGRYLSFSSNEPRCWRHSPHIIFVHSSGLSNIWTCALSPAIQRPSWAAEVSPRSGNSRYKRSLWIQKLTPPAIIWFECLYMHDAFESLLLC